MISIKSEHVNMLLLRALSLEWLLSSVFMLCWLQQTYTELYYQFSTVTPPSTTHRIFIHRKGLSLPIRNQHPAKCMREVPAIFAQYEKDMEIVGNSTDNRYFNIIESCCKGFRRYEYDWSQCVPDCGDKCLENGFCLEGGICKCFNEFVLNHRNNCIPTCPLGCPNGQCYLNGTCICNPGYELDASKKMCLPICEKACGYNELCVSPGACECMDGYARAVPDTASMGCQPVCIPDCGYGRCVAPNQCECFLGYHKRTNGTSCEASCYMRCENGFCVNRTTCGCQDGYKYDNKTTSCLPDCAEDCENGICVSPGVCRCFNGYRHKLNKCEGICNSGCGDYGKCIAPNICGCSIIDGSMRLYQRCEDGFCTSEGRCQCNQGKTRFLNKCLSPDKVTTHVSMNNKRMLNITFIEEFNYVIGKYFQFGIKFPGYYDETFDGYMFNYK